MTVRGHIRVFSTAILIVKGTGAMIDAFEMVSSTEHSIRDRTLLAANMTAGHRRAFRTQSIVKSPSRSECSLLRFSFEFRGFLGTSGRSLARAPGLLIDRGHVSTGKLQPEVQGFFSRNASLMARLVL